MGTILLRVPNGLRDNEAAWTKDIELDEMTGEEEDILADQTREVGGTGTFRKSGSARITAILSRCTLRIGDETRPKGKDRFDLPDHFNKAWQRAFSSDRIFAMVRLRQASLGEIYSFSRNCPECKREIKNITIDLSRLEVHEIPLEDAQQEERVLTLPKSRDLVTWKFVQGLDEEEMERIMKEHKEDFISALLYRRIVGVRPFDEMSQANLESVKPPGGLLYLKRMKTADRRYLSTTFDAVEGGIDTDITITCDNHQCLTEFTSKLQVMGSDFFFPSATPTPSTSTSALPPKTGDTRLTPSSESLLVAADA